MYAIKRFIVFLALYFMLLSTVQVEYKEGQSCVVIDIVTREITIINYHKDRYFVKSKMKKEYPMSLITCRGP